MSRKGASELDADMIAVTGDLVDGSVMRLAPHTAPLAKLRARHGAGVKILLAHQPRTATAAADAGFDLQTSGHTHGGQFFPWNFFVPIQQPYTAGSHRLRRLWVLPAAVPVTGGRRSALAHRPRLHALDWCRQTTRACPQLHLVKPNSC
jgi:predicted MPP superfamily phosphohydrolase